MTIEAKILTDEQIDVAQEAAYRALVEKGYNGGMGGYQWDRASARAIEQAVLQSAEVQRLRCIEKAAQAVLDWTEARHRPPVREAFPAGETAGVRIHALADLHDALHPDSPSKRAPLEQKT